MSPEKKEIYQTIKWVLPDVVRTLKKNLESDGQESKGYVNPRSVTISLHLDAYISLFIALLVLVFVDSIWFQIIFAAILILFGFRLALYMHFFDEVVEVVEVVKGTECN